ncbi:unnamed protein product [Brachionus calyciflorus]|uniref:PET117 n=1 Tax=Brachionus calyciflorus TaxID=104777 RepID=A0A813MB03_9BILA|nr:unnamed protein product [Brachionus calyciflorus]
MSTKAKLIFSTCCAVSGYIIYRVHEYQQEERDRVRQGVFRDIERRANKLKNQQLLEEQAELQRQLTNNKKD